MILCALKWNCKPGSNSSSLPANEFAKEKLSLARVIGLAPGQEFVLTEKAPYQALTPLPLDVYLQRAYASRSDYQAAQATRAGRRALTSGSFGGSLSLAGSECELRRRWRDPGPVEWHVAGQWKPEHSDFRGGKVHSDVLEAEAQLRQARSQLGDLRGRIDYEVRASLLDLNAAAEQVEVARSSVELAEEALAQSQDRFTAGVADNLEVVQAQESVAAAHESYIQSLYAHNLAKVELARAIGDAEQGVKRYLKGDQ